MKSPRYTSIYCKLSTISLFRLYKIHTSLFHLKKQLQPLIEQCNLAYLLLNYNILSMGALELC